MAQITKRSPKVYVVVGVLVVAVAIGLYYVVVNARQPGKYDDFARCLNGKGAVFYGAFWCPHCQNQKALFGKSQKHLNYVECSTPDSRGQTAQCRDKKIEGYPTWEFADGSRESGELSLKRLATKTGCVLPE
jgi:thiol-disulfide isomerase/thioredoxin